MSQFKTSIPVDVEAVTKLLPEGSFLHGVTWNPETKTVEVLWEHEKLLTGREFPVEFPRENLGEAGAELPKGVRQWEPPKMAAAPVQETASTPSAPPVEDAAAEIVAGESQAAGADPLPGPHAEAEAPAATTGGETANGPSDLQVPPSKGPRRRK